MRRWLLLLVALLPARALGVAWGANGATTVTAGTGTCTPSATSLGTIGPNDIILAVGQSENQTISLSTANGFTELTSSPQASGTAATSPATRLAVYWIRGKDWTAAPVFADSGDHTACSLHRISDADWNSTAGAACTTGGVDTASNTSVTIPGCTTGVANTFVVLIASNSNNATSTATCGSWTNANLATLTERFDSTNTSGLGGGHCLASGTYSGTGSFGNTTMTITAASWEGDISIAFKAQTTPGAPGDPTFTAVGQTTITVNWTAAGGAESYKVERAPDSGGSPGTYVEQVTGVTGLSWQDNTVSCGTTYWYRIRATNSAGDGSYDATPASQATSACASAASANSGMMGFLVEDAPGGGGSPTLAIDTGFPNQVTFSSNQTFTSGSITVGANRLVAIICATATGSIPTITSVSDTSGGAFSTWTQRKRQTETATSDNVTEIWTAYTTSGASAFTVSCTWSAAGQAGGISTYSFDGANSAPSAWNTCGNSANTSAAANCSITTTGTGSIVIGGGVGWNATTMTAATSNTILAQAADGTGNQIWTQRYDGSINAGTYTSGCSTTTLSKWSVASLEVQQAP